MTELELLRVLLLLGMAAAPLGTHRLLLPPSRRSTAAHIVALALAALGLFTPMPVLCGAWLIYCVAGLVLYLRDRAAALLSPHEFASLVPFVFSIVGAVWVVGGANELHVLGYGANFSYYAALHSTVLGWMMVGAISVLARQDSSHRAVYVGSVLVSFGSFLLVAIGIDGHPSLKPFGVLGLSLAIPIAQLAFLHRAWTTHKTAFALGSASLAGLAFTLVLAWQAELGALNVAGALGIRPMVSLHGLVNGVVVGPCFLLAVALETRASSPS